MLWVLWALTYSVSFLYTIMATLVIILMCRIVVNIEVREVKKIFADFF